MTVLDKALRFQGSLTALEMLTFTLYTFNMVVNNWYYNSLYLSFLLNDVFLEKVLALLVFIIM